MPLVIAALVVVSLGAKPTFQDVLKKFPDATMPLTIKTPGEQKTKLTAADVDALGFLKDDSALLASLRSWKKKADKGETKALLPIGRIVRTGHQLLLIRYDDDLPMMSAKETFLLSYNDKNELLGWVAFHRESSSEAGGATNLSTLDQAGMISRMIKATTPMMEEGLPPELVVTSEQRARVTATGALEVMAPAWSTRTGAYIDRKTKEELRVFDKRVFYRGNDSKPFQELEGDGNTVRFKDSPSKPYVLTWNDRRSAISCQNPGGDVQLFTREW
jgi:hypothetical protein